MRLLVTMSGVLPKCGSGLTWARHVFYRRNMGCHLQNLTRQFSSYDKEESSLKVHEESNNYVGRKSSKSQLKKVRKDYVSLVEKVRASQVTRNVKKTNQREFTAKELAEEEKFAKFLSEEFQTEQEDKFRSKETKSNIRDTEEHDHDPAVTRLFDDEVEETIIGKKVLEKKSLPENWKKRFGTLTPKGKGDDVRPRLDPGIRYMKELRAEEELGDLYNHVPLGNRNRRHEPDWYARRIVKLSKQGYIDEAVEVFEEWMIKRDRVKPTDYEYSVLISALGKVGYTKKAFKLFNEMQRKGYRIHPKVYSALFNACSNSPWQEDGLKRANDLRTFMLVRNVRPEYLTYQAMIKAYGMCGDLKTAFEVADESLHFHKVEVNLLTNLLVACITDKEAGFRHAIMVWRRFQKLKVLPEIRAYKLLLKATLECGIGEQKLLLQLLGMTGDRISTSKTDNNLLSTGINSKTETSLGDFEDTSVVSSSANVEGDNFLDFKPLSDDQAGDHDVLGQSSLVASESDRVNTDNSKTDNNPSLAVLDRKNTNNSSKDDNPPSAVLPSILDPDADFSVVLSVRKVVDRHDRFALLGNVPGLLKSMRDNRVELDIELFSYLIQLAPGMEIELVLDEMIIAGLDPDIDFCNRYLYRLIYEQMEIQEVLDVMKALSIKPNMKTYTSMSYGCKDMSMASAFLESMEKSGVMPNIHMMRGLMHASFMNLNYKQYVLKQMNKYDIKPDEDFLKKIEGQITKAHGKLRAMDEGKVPKNESFIGSFDTFLDFYEEWTKKVDIAETEHPGKDLNKKKSES